MTDSLGLKGKCLCGAVTVSATIEHLDVGACHCNMCRRWGGGPYMEVNCGTEVVFTGKESVSVYDSSDWAERSFCSKCGSHLFYRLKASGMHMVAVGLFENTDELRFKSQVFVDEKPGYYEFANDTENMTGAEVFAKFG